MPSDPTRPGGPRYSPAQRRLLTATAGLVVVALAAGAYVLTYPVLRELALAGRASRRWAPVYPVMADALTAMTILALVVARNARWWTRLLRWALLLLLVAGAAAAAVQHAVWGFGSLPRDAVRAGVAVAPHVMLVIAVWLWLTMIKQIRVSRPASDEPEPVEAQRGHVKVLPALEPPAALEAPADGAQPYEPAYEAGPARPLDLLPVGSSEAEHEIEHATVHEYEAVRDHEYEVPHGHRPGFEHDYEPALRHEMPSDDDYPSARGHEVTREDDYAGARGHDYGDADDDEHGYGVDYAEEYEQEPSPPLDPLPEPRPAPALLPTDVELVRGRDAEDSESSEEPRERARTTRPDIVVPGAEDPDDAEAPDGTEAVGGEAGANAEEQDEQDSPPADRAEDPDAGDGGDAPPVPRVPRPSPSPEDEREPGEGRIWDWNPPPSGNFRSGPTPPAE
ncbi:hypothetical protein [Actinomadura verrucosospora]|uniref:Cellulosome anchoring protein cohesin subunit n=1 Tax=Actinomadura verrucosospora TaxID=46165 RepID=A0A7D3VT84_ACTVE|nr:hypothetical protein [Actinomadura verrucosospora]QKG22615.1 cellulosome anchoring protein cohesin subunit [Actinomadura verrucosospora]